MGTILVVDERRSHRDFLIGLLGETGHQLRAAHDGAEALDIVRRDSPELVIAGIRMPTMPGDEFVRRIRANSRRGATAVILSTSADQEREARDVAERCGVMHLLAWPMEPVDILRTVAEAMGPAWLEASTALPMKAERDDLRRRNLDLSEKVRSLEVANRRLNALHNLGRSLGRERDPKHLLARYCQVGRELLGARRAVFGVLDDESETIQYLLAHGEEMEELDPKRFSAAGAGLPGLVVTGAMPVRAVAIEGEPLRVFPGQAPARSFLGVPVATARRRYGVLAFIDKETPSGFDDEDQELAMGLSAQLAVAYEALLWEAEMARGAAQVERYAKQLAILRRIDRAILAAHRPREVASAVVRHLRQLLGCWSVGIWVFDWETRTAERLASEGAAEPLLPPGTKVPLEALGVPDLEALEAGQDRMVEDVSLLPEPAQTVRMLQIAGLRSYTRLPLAFEGQLIGTLVLSSDRTGCLDEEQLEIARQVADQLAIAMRHALLFHQVHASGERLRTLSHQLLKAQEEERRRIARELHDEIGQSLTAVKINLQRATGDEAWGASSPPFRESVALIDQLLNQVRNISLDLRPSVLDDLGLVASVRWHLDCTSRRAGFVGTFSADPPEIRLSPEIETECFRVVQEALTNVLKHAAARRVDVTLFWRGEFLDLIVQDDGAGFDVFAARQRAARGGSLGLLGLQERAALLGGLISIEADPGHGTKVHLRIPMADPGVSRATERAKEAP